MNSTSIDNLGLLLPNKPLNNTNAKPTINNWLLNVVIHIKSPIIMITPYMITMIITKLHKIDNTLSSFTIYILYKKLFTLYAV